MDEAIRDTIDTMDGPVVKAKVGEFEDALAAHVKVSGDFGLELSDKLVKESGKTLEMLQAVESVGRCAYQIREHKDNKPKLKSQLAKEIACMKQVGFDYLKEFHPSLVLRMAEAATMQ